MRKEGGWRYKEATVVEAEDAEDAIEGGKEGGMEDGAKGDIPLPREISVAKDGPVGDLEGLPVLVWAKVGADEECVDGAECNESCKEAGVRPLMHSEGRLHQHKGTGYERRRD